jgi:hypothetical protein
MKVKGKFYLYYKGFNAPSKKSRKIGLAISDSPTGPFKKHDGNPIIDWSDKTGVEVPVVFNHHGKLGMLLMTFNPRKHMFLTSADGIIWSIQNQHFSGGMDIGLVKDRNNNLLPYYIQFVGRPLSLKVFNLQISERDGQQGAEGDAVNRAP